MCSHTHPSTGQKFATYHERITWSVRFMEAAAEKGHLEVLRWLARDGRIRDPDWGETGLSGSVAWSVGSCYASEEKDAPPSDDIIARSAAQNRQTSVVRDLHARGYQVTILPMHSLLTDASTEKVQWLHDHSFPVCSKATLDIPAASGNLQVLQWLQNHGVTRCTTDAIDWAAAFGHLHVIQRLHENRTEGCTSRAMLLAAMGGHLEVLKWLHVNRTEGCTTGAMDIACSNGHLNVAEWLHFNRSEGCSQSAMDGAPRTVICISYNGSTRIAMKWLHENRSEGCTTDAMVRAVYARNLSVVQWLHEHRTEGCTPGAMNRAMMTGDFEIALFLHTNRSEGCDEDIGQSDWLAHHLEMFAWVCERYRDKLHIETMLRRVDMARHPYLEAVLEELGLVPPRQH